MELGWLTLTVAGIALEITDIVFLIRGNYQRFPVVLTYLLFLLLSSVLETASSFARVNSVAIYWFDDIVQHGLLIVLVLALTAQALEEAPNRQTVLMWLRLGIIAVAAGSLWLFYDPRLSRWMTSFSRNLSFSEEILNVVLWGALIRKRNPDFQLLLVSAGLGVQVTAEVIGHTLRLYAQLRSILWLPNAILNVGEVLCLLIWLAAFRKPVPAIAGPVTNSSSA